MLNGYKTVYMPQHKRAYKNGCVYEHIIQAEKMLGRELDENECVHHIDFDKTNNNFSNLLVFKTLSDHTAFHNGGTLKECDYGVYAVIDKNKNKICPLCGGEKDYKSKMCIKCRKVQRKRNIPDKEALLELLKNNTKSKIARMYGVSDTAVRKWAKTYKLM